MEDAALVAAAVGGDKSAFAAIYDRYADAVHDFCWSVLRDRDEAADIMQDTFLIAARQLATLREPSKLRSWLFAIARHEAIRRGKKLKRAVPTEGVGEMELDRGGSPDVEAGVDVDRAGIQALVWAAADGLSDRDKAILDLNLRQGLEGQELADALGVSASQSYVLMSRLRDQVERSIGALLVARKGSDECTELQSLLQGWDGRFTPLMRKRVARHVERCEICTEERKGLLSPLAVFAATPAMAAPAGLRDKVLGQIELTAASRPPRGWQGDGFPPADRASRRGPLLAAVAAIVVILALAVGASRLGSGGERPQFADPEATTTTAARRTSTTVTTTTTTVGGVVEPPTTDQAPGTTLASVPVVVPAAHLVVSKGVDLGDQLKSGTFTITNDGGTPLSWTATSSQPWLTVSTAGTLPAGTSQTVVVQIDRSAAPEGDVTAIITVDAADAGSGTATVSAYVTPVPPVIKGISGPTGDYCQSYALILATVEDQSQVTVTVDWYDDQKNSGTVEMKQNQGGWSATISGYVEGTVTYTVHAFDQWGADAAPVSDSFTYKPC